MEHWFVSLIGAFWGPLVFIFVWTLLCIIAIVLLRDALAVNEPAPDEKPITRLLFFVAPSPRAHLEMLAQLSTALLRGNLQKLMNESAPDDELFAAIAAAENPAKKEGNE